MAVTGLILFGFVLGHMVGNLQVYLGPEALNHYGALLRQLLHGAGLWVVRAVMLCAVSLHIWSATSLTLESRRARPEGLPRAEVEGVHVRLTHDAVGRRDPPLLRDLPPAPLHDRHGASGLHRGRHLPQLRRRLSERAGLALLHRRDAALWGSTCATACGACSRRSAFRIRATSAWRTSRPGSSPSVVVVGNISFPIAVLAGIVK